jgi:hypothetical protein
MDSLYVPLVGALIAGIAFVAYNHREEYHRHCYKLVGALFLLLLAIWAWDGCVVVTSLTMKPFVAPEKVAAAMKAAGTVTVPNKYQMLVAALPLYVWAADMVSAVIHKKPDQSK